MKNLITILIFTLGFGSIASANVDKQQFDHKYPKKCFAVDEQDQTKDKTSECRMSRLKFYMEYISRQPSNQDKGNIEQLYTMIRLRKVYEEGLEVN